jgi:hypothetical protein
MSRERARNLATAVILSIVHTTLLGAPVADAKGLVLCVKSKGSEIKRAFFRKGSKSDRKVCPDGFNDPIGIPEDIVCWDRNRNGRCDPNGEDFDGDGDCTTLDCRGSECWDRNGNGNCERGEDVADPRGCDILDCIGPEGLSTGLGVTLDLGADGDARPDSDLKEISTIGDDNAVFSETSAGALRIDAGRAWSKADKLTRNPTVCSADSEGRVQVPKGIDDGGNALGCAPLRFGDLVGLEALDTVPLAQSAERADSLAPGAVQRPDNLSRDLCSDGQFLKRVGVAWRCDHVADTANVALDLGKGALDNADAVADGLCANDQFLKKVGGRWQCESEAAVATRARRLDAGGLDSLSQISSSLCDGNDAILHRINDRWECTGAVPLAEKAAALAEGALAVDKFSDIANLCPEGELLKRKGNTWGCDRAPSAIRVVPANSSSGKDVVSALDNIAIAGQGGRPGLLVGHDGTSELVFDPVRSASVTIVEPTADFRVGIFQATSHVIIKSVSCIVDPPVSLAKTSRASVNIKILALDPVDDSNKNPSEIVQMTCPERGNLADLERTGLNYPAGTWIFLTISSTLDNPRHLTTQIAYTAALPPPTTTTTTPSTVTTITTTTTTTTQP